MSIDEQKDAAEPTPESTGSVAYRTFDDWHSEIEGFAMRCELLDGPVDELRAAFAAGQSGMRLTDAEREAVERACRWIASTMPYESRRGEEDYKTLRGLLERLK